MEDGKPTTDIEAPSPDIEPPKEVEIPSEEAEATKDVPSREIEPPKEKEGVSEDLQPSKEDGIRSTDVTEATREIETLEETRTDVTEISQEIHIPDEIITHETDTSDEVLSEVRTEVMELSSVIETQERPEVPEFEIDDTEIVKPTKIIDEITTDDAGTPAEIITEVEGVSVTQEDVIGFEVEDQASPSFADSLVAASEADKPAPKAPKRRKRRGKKAKASLTKEIAEVFGGFKVRRTSGRAGGGTTRRGPRA